MNYGTYSDIAFIAWVGVALFFVAGDAATTYAGFAVGAVEGNPVAVEILGAAGFAGMIAAKAFVAGVAYVFYRRADVYAAAIPASLAILGMVIVAWNTAVVYTLLTS